MQKHRVFWASVLANLLILCLFPGMARASNVSVDCDAGGSINDALATLTPTGPNQITVTGTCNEGVPIGDFRSLTIVGGGGARIVAPQDSDAFDIFRSQNITLRNLEIAGVPGIPTAAFGGTGVLISQASNVQIKGCDIHDNQGGGVFATGGSLLFLINTNIHNNNPFNGLQVSGNSNAAVGGSTIQNNGSPGVLTYGNQASVTGGVGVFVAGNSRVNFQQNNLIQNNADIGIWARSLSTVGFGGDPTLTTTIQGHNITGIFIQEGAHLQVNAAALIQGNGVACPPVTSIACGGIFGVGNATVELAGVGTISGNHGAGIFAEQGTNLHLNGATISNNSGDGVHIRWISTADIREFGGGANTITGNGGASVFCDATSLVIGNLSGFPNVKCGQNSPN